VDKEREAILLVATFAAQKRALHGNCSVNRRQNGGDDFIKDVRRIEHHEAVTLKK
jgi:hypothetical protein